MAEGSRARRFAERTASWWGSLSAQPPGGIRSFAGSPVWLLLLLILPAILPLAAPGYFFKAHDARHSVFWLVEFDAAFRDGAIWPIWAPDHLLGFGYPLWLAYAPLAYFVGEAFHLLGLGFTAAVKATWALSFLIGALGMNALARRWWGKSAGLIAALAYTYAPYHLAQIYVRAALAEFVSLAIFPWVLLAFAALWDDARPRRAGLAALALGALLLTHSGAAILYLPVVGGFLAVKALVTLRRREKLWPATGASVLALALGLMLAGIFLIPLFLERGFLGQEIWLKDTYRYWLHFVYPSQFLDPSWGYGYSVPGPDDGMSFQLGILPFLGAAAGAWIIVRAAQRRAGADDMPALPEAFFFLALGLIAIFAMTPAARALWDALPPLTLIQFPWRLLALTAVALALLTAVAARRLEQADAAASRPFVYVAALALMLASFPYTRPELVAIRPADESPLALLDFEMAHPDMRGMTFWAQRQPADADSPLLPQYLAGQPLTKAAIVSGQGTILAQSHTANSAYARVRAEGPVRLRFYTSYFPGWRATVDGQPAAISADPPNGLIGLDLPAGEHEVSLRFGATPARSAAAAASIAALLVALGFATLPLPGRSRERVRRRR